MLTVGSDMTTSDPNLYPYLPYDDRPKLSWPGDASIAVWLAPNIEFYELRPPDSKYFPPWQKPIPDVPGYALRDYSPRVGVWRLMDLFAKHDIRASVSLSAAVCDHYPDIIAACNELGWEFFGHGIYNTRMITGMSSEQERELIRDTAGAIQDATGQKMSGWLGPWLSNSTTIADNLAVEGVDYTLDLFHDDQPTPINVADGRRLISVPYAWVVNDAPLFQGWNTSPSAYELMLRRQFTQLYEEGADNPTVMAIPLHPYLVGQPHRLQVLDRTLEFIKSHDKVWFPTGREIAAWYYEHHYDTVVAFQSSKDSAHVDA
jgi:allantoinase